MGYYDYEELVNWKTIRFEYFRQALFCFASLLVVLTMQNGCTYYRRGYTIVELMVTILIVSVMATSLGAFFVKLINLHEKEREEAYIREHLLEICANFADYMSIGTNVVYSTSEFVVSYRHETGGVSLETGRVVRASQMTASVNSINDEKQPKIMHLNVAAFEQGNMNDNKFSRNLRADDTPLIPLNSLKELRLKNGGKVDLSYEIRKFNTDASLWKLKIIAEYEVEDDDDDPRRKVEVERIVRLWNWIKPGSSE